MIWSINEVYDCSSSTIAKSNICPQIYGEHNFCSLCKENNSISSAVAALAKELECFALIRAIGSLRAVLLDLTYSSFVPEGTLGIYCSSPSGSVLGPLFSLTPSHANIIQITLWSTTPGVLGSSSFPFTLWIPV